MDKSPSRRQSLFRFKKFAVDQTGCAMKINTDGVLLGAMAMRSTSKSTGMISSVLDIGTGTGVVALMLAQRFPSAQIDAIDIDPPAAARAGENFRLSSFSDRLTAFPTALQDFRPIPALEKYHLIVSNPPFFVDSLKNPDTRKQLARHADRDFFSQLLHRSAGWLRPAGYLELILPPDLAAEVGKQAVADYGFSVGGKTDIYSFSNDAKPIRTLLTLCRKEAGAGWDTARASKFVIYAGQGMHSLDYKALLADFFLAF